MKFCPSCGTPMPEGARFCTACGNRMPAAPAAAPEAPQAPAPPEEPLPPPRPYAPRPAQPVPPQASYFRQSAPPPPARPAQPSRASWAGGYDPPRPPSPNRYASPRPSYASYRQPDAGPGRRHPPAGKPPLKHRGALRFLSFLFALGLLAVAAGIGSGIYYSRFIDRSLSGFLEREKKETPVTPGQKEKFAEALSAAMAKDVRKAMAAQMAFAQPGAEPSEISGADPALLAPYQAKNDEWLRTGEKQFGLRWTILRIGMNSRLLTIAGGILAGAAMILWFALGGRLSRFTKAANTPILTMLVIWGICLVLILLLIPAVNFFDIDAADAVPGENAPAVNAPVPGDSVYSDGYGNPGGFPGSGDPPVPDQGSPAVSPPASTYPPLSYFQNP